MLDLNVDVLSVDSTYHGTEAKIEIVKLSQPSGTMSEDTGTSSSSVVNADDSPASAGDENSSSTQTRTYASALCFDIVDRGTSIKDDDVKNKLYLNSVPELVTKQFFPVAGEGGVADSDEFTSGQPLTAGLLRPKWLNLSVPESGAAPVLRIFDQPKPQAPQPPPQVRKSRRGPRSRSSEYRGVTFYRRTGRWESHIWDCGKQVYLGGFDTAHAAARAYDRAAIKFRGVDADINFHISDYDEDMQQTKNLSKEEFVHVLRRQSTGFARGSSRYRGVTVQKCGRWEARMGQLIGKKAYDKAAMGCNGQEAVTNIDSSTYQGELTLVANDGDSNHNLDLGLWVSPPQDARKGNVNVKDLRLHPAPYQLPDGKRLKVDSSMTAALGGQTPNALHYPIPQAKYPGFKPNYEEGVIGRREGLGFSKWAWEMQQQGHHNNSNSIMMSQVAPPFTSTSSSNNTNAASSGFSSFPNPLQHNLIPTKNHYHQTYLPYNHKT